MGASAALVALAGTVSAQACGVFAGWRAARDVTASLSPDGGGPEGASCSRSARFQAVGAWSIGLLITLRFIDGLFLGGQYTTAVPWPCSGARSTSEACTAD
jgi:hypothetical protein